MQQSSEAGPTGWRVALAVVSTCIAGIAYAACGVIIRSHLQQDLTLSATLVLLNTIGVVVLGALSLATLGPAEMWATSPSDATAMLLAGVFNAVAFFAIAAALRTIAVLQANLLNATQTAMAAVAGVWLFGEEWTLWLVLGTLLTVLGVMLMDKRRSSDEEATSEAVPAASSAVGCPTIVPVEAPGDGS
jgi:drug/metabolite transporter (DMT)-like permease